jgi:type VI secretion system protein ImpL
LPAAPAPAAQAQAPASGQGFKRLRLPETITAPRTAAPAAPAAAPVHTAQAGGAQ